MESGIRKREREEWRDLGLRVYGLVYGGGLGFSLKGVQLIRV